MDSYKILLGVCTVNFNAPGKLTKERVKAIFDLPKVKKCKNVKVKIGNGVTAIGNYAFWDCKSLTSIKIPEGVTTVGERAFYNCTGLTSIVISEGVTTIGDSAFRCCSGIDCIVIPESATTIGDYAFSWCSGITSIVIPEGVTTIGKDAFYECSGLTTITVAEGNQAYKSVDGNLYTKNGKTLVQYTIGKEDTHFEIPEGVTTIGNNAFSYCRSLTSITIAEGNQAYKSVDGNLYTKDGKTLVQYAIGKEDTHFEIPEGVKTIGDYAFIGCSGITSIVIPEGVTTIGDSAFWYCTSLTSIVIPESVTTIGDYAFCDCKSLTSIVIPEGVTTIGWSAFSWCDSLTSIVIPEGVTTIGNYAFEGCTSLTIYCEAQSRPSGWNPDWNYSRRPVVWGRKIERKARRGKQTNS